MSQQKAIRFPNELFAKLEQRASELGVDFPHLIRAGAVLALREDITPELLEAAAGNPVGNHTLTSEQAKRMRKKRTNLERAAR